MGTWKSLKTASGTGWKAIDREAGTGWKALEFESAYEDFTTFTEVDVAADRIQKTANHIDYHGYRNERTYLYKDYSAVHFGDFTHKIKVKFVASSAYAMVYLWILANNVGSGDQIHGYTHIEIYFYETTGEAKSIQLRERYSNTSYTTVMTGIAYDTWYYIKLVKSGTSFNAYIYSDSDYSTLLDTLSLTLHADHTFRYLYGCNTYYHGGAGDGSVDIENFDLG